MTKAKKPKARLTPLDQIAAKLHALLQRQTRDVIEIGNLLIKSREHLEHGQWLPWLEENFDLSKRTAHNYCKAAEYDAAKGKLATIANLAPGVLYELAEEGHYDKREEAAILDATRKGRVDQIRVEAIIGALPPADAEAEDTDDQKDDGSGDTEAAAEDDPEIDAILDGSSPAVPPSAPIPSPTNFALNSFDQAVSQLKTIMTKPLVQFAGTVHSTDDLEKVKGFVEAVLQALRQR